MNCKPRHLLLCTPTIMQMAGALIPNITHLAISRKGNGKLDSKRRMRKITKSGMDRVGDN